MPNPTGTEPDPSRRVPGDAFDFDGEYGERYEALALRLIPAYEQLFQMAVALLERAAPERARVLVVGAGTGVEMAAFGAAKPLWDILGVDPSPQMIELARRKLDALRLASPRLALHEGFVSDLPGEPAFDAATLYNVLHFLPDDGAKAALLRDIASRLRPGGSLILFDLHGDPASDEFDRLDEAWAAYMSVRGMPEADRAVFRRRLAEGIHYVPEERILQLLLDAGFAPPVRFFRAFLYGGWIAERREVG